MWTSRQHMMIPSPPVVKDDEEWRKIHTAPPMLSSLSGGQIQFWALKKGAKGFAFRWKKRYFKQQGSFVYYFDSDSATSVCRGCFYLPGARMKPSGTDEGKDHILSVRPIVPRHPGIRIDAPENEWHLAFETDAELTKMKEALEHVAQTRAEQLRPPKAATTATRD
eukprot:TRINITY_DN21157_c0_g1_i1.p1 TRINITY_DN21157_c0_g1~~TRINITY_DN21157_c0_g1_i1.p1  ORF type:complete len:166 (-),score=7.69 TRINITY_DN21157_c0_g1_i1:114-611(-)